jgi:hypothetical protein
MVGCAENFIGLDCMAISGLNSWFEATLIHASDRQCLSDGVTFSKLCAFGCRVFDLIIAQ